MKILISFMYSVFSVNTTTQHTDLQMNIKENATKEVVKNETSIPNVDNTDQLIGENNSSIAIPLLNKTEEVDDLKDMKSTKLNAEITTTGPQLSPSTEKILTTPSTTTLVTESIHIEKNDTKQPLEEYEDEEEEEDEGFSFGSVLKLLLSDSYETTTTAPKQQSTIYVPKRPVTMKPTTTTTPAAYLTTKRLPPKPILPFIPMPHHPYVPPKKSYTQNTVNRIDHLVLGEATAIKKTTVRPASTPIRPVVSYKPVTKSTTQTPVVTRSTETTRREEESSVQPVTHSVPRPVGTSALSLPGMLKLAGCNIYGRMYRVGRIITELSTPCQECWCTELGVQCNPLKC
jgi:hypothetical protein